jgi:FemAB-related protein (PEP-CTERM system-associated)
MTTAPDRVDVRVASAAADLVSSGAMAGLDGSRLAHAPEWVSVIRTAYGHDPLYLRAEDPEGRRGALPAFIVRRPLGGTVVSSMPFLDGGGPCSSSRTVADALVVRLIDEARRLGADRVELRCAERLGIAQRPMEHKVNLTLSLPPEAGRLWRQLDGSVRNQIRKAERSGLSIEIGGGEKLDDFYAIFAMRMRELGSPVHARRFFGAIVDAFADRARLTVVRKGTTPVGGLVALAFKDVFTVPWASCLSEYRALCPNMLLYWETIRSACAQGFHRFDFGRSTRGSGTYRFKRQWGAEEEALFWYTIPMSGGRLRHHQSAGRSAAFLTESWRRLPLGVTRRLGPHIRKYLTQ